MLGAFLFTVIFLIHVSFHLSLKKSLNSQKINIYVWFRKINFFNLFYQRFPRNLIQSEASPSVFDNKCI